MDVGAAGGYFLRSLLKYGAYAGNLFGVDIWESRVLDGRIRVPSLTLLCADGKALPFPDESFELVVQLTMFSSIIDFDIRQAIAAEMKRVVKKTGAIFSYDFRFKRPGDDDVCAMTKARVRELFKGLPDYLPTLWHFASTTEASRSAFAFTL